MRAVAAVRGCLHQRREAYMDQYLLEPIVLPATLQEHQGPRETTESHCVAVTLPLSTPLARIFGPHPSGPSSSAAIQLLPPSGLPPQTRNDNCCPAADAWKKDLQVHSLQEHNRSPHRSKKLLSRAMKSEGVGVHRQRRRGPSAYRRVFAASFNHTEANLSP